MTPIKKLEKLMQLLGEETTLIAIAKAIGLGELNTVCDAIANDYEINFEEEEEEVD